VVHDTAATAICPARWRRARFRADLYHRIDVYPIRIPPLRERVLDLSLVLVRRGFRGPVFLYAGHRVARRGGAARRCAPPGGGREPANRRGYTKHRPALPLVATNEEERALALLCPRG
jgi:hypothetical protein